MLFVMQQYHLNVITEKENTCCILYTMNKANVEHMKDCMYSTTVLKCTGVEQCIENVQKLSYHVNVSLHS